MAYPKITVNTGLVLDVIVKSDTVNIPWPGAQITGTGTAVDSGTNTATNNKKNAKTTVNPVDEETKAANLLL